MNPEFLESQEQQFVQEQYKVPQMPVQTAPDIYIPDAAPMIAQPQQTQHILISDQGRISVIMPRQEMLNCNLIYCQCEPPKFVCWQIFCGLINAIFPGTGLYCGLGCYGCSKYDCCSVCCAGFCQSTTAPFVVGWVSSCLVGLRMMGCCLG